MIPLNYLQFCKEEQWWCIFRFFWSWMSCKQEAGDGGIWGIFRPKANMCALYYLNERSWNSRSVHLSTQASLKKERAGRCSISSWVRLWVLIKAWRCLQCQRWWESLLLWRLFNIAHLHLTGLADRAAPVQRFEHLKMKMRGLIQEKFRRIIKKKTKKTNHTWLHYEASRPLTVQTGNPLAQVT